MAENRVQYQQGLSLPEFFQDFGTQQQCEALVRAWRWPRGFICPKCEEAANSEFRRGHRLYFQCGNCRYQCSLVSGTIFQSSKLPLTKWFLAMHLITQAKNNVSALELMRHIAVTYPTAWLLKHKIMHVMARREKSRQLTGRVEIDDAYLGGEIQGGKPGRGSPNKVPFVAAVQTTEAGHPVLICLSPRPFTKESIKEFAAQSLAAPVTLVCDGRVLQGRARQRHPSRAARQRRWCRQRPQPFVHRRQHRPGQHQDLDQRHVSRVRVRQVRKAVPRPDPVPVQSPIRSAKYPAAPRALGLPDHSAPASCHSRG